MPNYLASVRKAIFDVMHDSIALGNPQRAREIIKESTKLSKDDLGEWAPRSRVVVYTEMGLPTPAYEVYYIELWQKVDDLLRERGIKLYHEMINAAVLAFYDA